MGAQQVVRAAAAALILAARLAWAEPALPADTQPASQPTSMPTPATLAAKVEKPAASLPALAEPPTPKKRNKLVYAFAAGGVLVAIGLVALAGIGGSTQRIEVKWAP
jgi:hypothetical protein